MATPTIAWDETSPANSQSRGLGDDRIREMKTQVREVIAIDHIMASSGNSETTGYHNKVTFQTQGSSPSAVADTIILFAKDVSGKAELHFIDEDGNEMQLTSGGHFVGGMTGEVKMWSGALANIPAGWGICDGVTASPNLLGKFIRGINTAVTEPGATGGSDTITDIVSHTHSATVASSGAHTHTGTTNSASVTYTTGAGVYDTSGINVVSGGSSHAHTFSIASSGSHTHMATSANPAGDVASYDNRPAYYELAFIGRV